MTGPPEFRRATETGWSSIWPLFSDIGRAFAEVVPDEARALGFSGMQFNPVVATNERALRLWRSLGFAEVGRVPTVFRHALHGPTDLVIMHRGL